jgi:predicted RNase H-like HicB family nuclease
MQTYPAMLYAKGDGFLVVLADFSDIKATGRSAQEAARNAAAVLARHLETLVAKGLSVPLPSRLDDLLGKEPANLVARLLIPVDFIGQVVRLNISMDEGVLALADRHSSRLGMTRSGYIAHLIRSDRDKIARAEAAIPEVIPAAKTSAKKKPKSRKR